MTNARDLFEIPEGGPYLLSHSVGCLPRSARARLETGLFEPWSRKGSTGWNDWLSTIDSFRAAVACLIGGQMEEVCPQPGVSTALFRLLSGLPRREGRNVLLASAHAFASMAYVMGQLRPLGYRLELLPESVDPTDPQAWRAAMGADTAAVLVMHVHSNTGLASPVAEIAAEARAAGAVSIIDVAQSAGILPVDVAAWGADAVVGSCVKWLCGGPGAGFLWVSPALLPQTTPLDAGWFSHAEPFEFDIRDFRYAPDARRFWGGTPSIAPYILATAGIETLAGLGEGAALAHNRGLIARVAERSGLPLDMTGRGATLCLQPGAEIDAIAGRLAAAGCHFDRRGETLRLSFHIYNDGREADLVGDCLAGI